jgi:hypothetical protein
VSIAPAALAAGKRYGRRRRRGGRVIDRIVVSALDFGELPEGGHYLVHGRSGRRARTARAMQPVRAVDGELRDAF